jgi:hypothetical protein
MTVSLPDASDQGYIFNHFPVSQIIATHHSKHISIPKPKSGLPMNISPVALGILFLLAIITAGCTAPLSPASHAHEKTPGNEENTILPVIGYQVVKR